MLLPATTGKRKAKKTLTKIDPSTLKQRPQATSQHAADNGTRVTTTVNPILQPPVIPGLDTFTFDADASNFDEEFLEDGGGASRGYYVARVCTFNLLLSV